MTSALPQPTDHMRTMARRRVETDRLQELVRLHRMGCSARRVARLLRMGSNTERQYRRLLEGAGLLSGPPTELPPLDAIKAAVTGALGPEDVARPRASAFDAWRSVIESLVEKKFGARAVYDRLRLQPTGKPLGSYSGMKRFVRQLRRERAEGAGDVAIPVESAPGEVAQVDFGYAGRLYDAATGRVRRTWIFIMILCHSRLMFVQLVFDQRVETWLQLHEQAFASFGGGVITVVPDNMKRAVLRAAFRVDGRSELNRSYRELAQHYGFQIDPTPPRAPRKKGKVEAAVKYVTNNPLKGRDGEPFDQVQAALLRWNREVASTRVHGSTRRRPIDVFEQEERAALRPLPSKVYEPAIWKKARVHPDSHVSFRDRLFSVPWQLIHEDVWIRASRARLDVLHDDRCVATHERTSRWRTTIEAHLPDDRRELRHRGRKLWEERAERIGPETLGLVRAIFDSDDVLSRLRQVQAIVACLERFPTVRAEATARRARRVGDLTYQGVKRTLTLALDVSSPHPSIVRAAGA